MGRQVCVSEDDPAHSDRDPTHNWELRETMRVMRTTAQQREEPRSEGADKTTGSTSVMLKHFIFLELIKHTANPTGFHMKTLLRVCAELYCLSSSTFLDELGIASAHCYPILRHISLNLSGLSAAQHATCDRLERVDSQHSPSHRCLTGSWVSQQNLFLLTAIGRGNQLTQMCNHNCVEN